jgi:hypothetical protein
MNLNVSYVNGGIKLFLFVFVLVNVLESTLEST